LDDSSAQIGVDIGGTFTDLLLYDEANGSFTIGKTLTTSQAPADAVRGGIEHLLATASVPPGRIDRIVHGTTLVTNALIERKGVKTALITTKGFRDALEIAREHRYDLYDLFLERAQPLTPRDLRFEINERVLADGSILTPVDPHEVERLARCLVESGVEAVAVALLHSYQYPEHERAVVEILNRFAPATTVSASSDVVPEIREYERTSTTVANVYVRPVVSAYLDELVLAIAALGIDAPLFIMLSSGGITTVETAGRYPIRLIESGPAAGALAAAHYGRLTNRPSLLSFDMGGTTAKCCLIDHGKPSVSAEFEVNRVYRFKKGSGLPIQVPVIEMIEIGAGGGSMARIDALGLLKVGPDSAGSAPGPVCYARGGTTPTVTDADLVLGYLDPTFFLGGEMALDINTARVALGELGERLGLSALETAWGIHELVNEQMAGAARVHAIEQGKDPRAYPVFAFGGAGPVHAYRVAEILRSPEVVLPLGAGVTSTVGFLLAPLSFEFVRSLLAPLDGIDWTMINERFAEMEAEGRQILASAGVKGKDVRVARSVDLRYIGQGHDVRVPVPPGALDPTAAPSLSATFETAYRQLFGRLPEGNAIEAINWRLVVRGPSPDLPLQRFLPDRDGEATRNARKADRPVYLPEHRAMVPTPVYDRYALKPGDLITGPAIVEERESTVVISGPATATVDHYRNLVIAMPDSESGSPPLLT
jgi:N-methylhydantoinase A